MSFTYYTDNRFVSYTWYICLEYLANFLYGTKCKYAGKLLCKARENERSMGRICMNKLTADCFHYIQRRARRENVMWKVTIDA